MTRAVQRQAAQAFIAAQAASLSGQHELAEERLAACLATGAPPPHFALQAALIAARRGDLPTALARLAEAPESPVRQLFEGWLLARAGEPEAGLARLTPLLAAEPENRVAADALAYAHLRAGQPAAALRLLAEGPGDNFELLSYVWLELERAALALPPRDTPPPEVVARPLGRLAARRLYRAAEAVVLGYHLPQLRRRWLTAARAGRGAARLVRPLLELLERLWPTDALTTFLQLRAAGASFPTLGLNLGAQLYEEGHPSAARPELETAWEALRETPEGYLPGLYLAAVEADLRHWDRVEALLLAVARLDEPDGDEAGQAHEFAQPHWFALRGRLRLVRGDETGAHRDLLRALDGEPLIFDERWRRLAPLLSATAEGHDET